MSPPQSRFAVQLLLSSVLACVGCRSTSQVRDSEYAAIRPLIPQACAPYGTEQFARNPVVPELAGPHAVDDYIAFALMQNPRIQAARKAVEAKAYRVVQAASLNDPSLNVMGWPSIPHAPQYVNGRMTSDLSISQTVPWLGTLSTQAAMADKDVDVARAQLAAAELDVIQNVKKSYYELYYVQQALSITEQEHNSLTEIVGISETKVGTGKASQQDLLRAQLEVSNLGVEQIRLRQQLASAQASLNRHLHVSPETPVRTLEQLPAESLPADLDRLYSQAVLARPELHAALASIDRDREQVALARLKYFPDATLSTGWSDMTTNGAMSPIADGRGNWNIGLMVNLPVYRKRLDAAVRQAEATVVSGARDYDAMRDETLESVKDQFAQASSQREMLDLFRDDIIPKANQTLEVSIRAYEVSEVDFLQLIDNWRQVLRFQIAQLRLEAQFRQSLAMLERTVGGFAAEFNGSEVPPPVEPLPPQPRSQ